MIETDAQRAAIEEPANKAAKRSSAMDLHSEQVEIEHRTMAKSKSVAAVPTTLQIDEKSESG
jgi:hypothetical protein